MGQRNTFVLSNLRPCPLGNFPFIPMAFLEKSEKMHSHDCRTNRSQELEAEASLGGNEATGSVHRQARVRGPRPQQHTHTNNMKLLPHGTSASPPTHPHQHPMQCWLDLNFPRAAWDSISVLQSPVTILSSWLGETLHNKPAVLGLGQPLQTQEVLGLQHISCGMPLFLLFLYLKSTSCSIALF